MFLGQIEGWFELLQLWLHYCYMYGEVSLISRRSKLQQLGSIVLVLLNSIACFCLVSDLFLLWYLVCHKPVNHMSHLSSLIAMFSSFTFLMLKICSTSQCQFENSLGSTSMSVTLMLTVAFYSFETQKMKAFKNIKVEMLISLTCNQIQYSDYWNYVAQKYCKHQF